MGAAQPVWPVVARRIAVVTRRIIDAIGRPRNISVAVGAVRPGERIADNDAGEQAETERGAVIVSVMVVGMMPPMMGMPMVRSARGG
jgi:hypothetical protein